MIKQSLSFITIILMIVISGCAAPNKDLSKKLVYENEISKEISENNLILRYSMNDKNKEYLISSLLKKDYAFDVVFSNDEYSKIDDILIESNLSFFCNSFLADQKNKLNSVLFDDNDSHDRVLVIYTPEYENEIIFLKENFSEAKFFLLENSLYENFVMEVIGVDSSTERYKKIQALDKNITIESSPREYKDFDKIYFLMDHEIGKTVIPIFRSYLITTEFYSTAKIFIGASSLKELNDFENMFIPTSDYIFKKIALKDSILSIEDEFNRALMEDLISAEIIDQNNLYGINFVFNSGLSKTKRSQCLERELPLWKVSLNDFNLL